MRFTNQVTQLTQENSAALFTCRQAKWHNHLKLELLACMPEKTVGRYAIQREYRDNMTGDM
jgi:hypothetical protein